MGLNYSDEFDIDVRFMKRTGEPGGIGTPEPEGEERFFITSPNCSVDTCPGDSCVNCGTDATCFNTCAPTCRATCPATCPATCHATCPNTCVNTCPNTCANTCQTCQTFCNQNTCHTCNQNTCVNTQCNQNTCANTCPPTCHTCAQVTCGGPNPRCH